MKTIILILAISIQIFAQGSRPWGLIVYFSDDTFTPDKVTSATLAAWYEFDDLSTITKNAADSVSAWADKSGNNRTLSQTTDNNKPEWSINGVTFDGSSDYMKTATFTLNQPFVIYAIIKPVTWTNLDYIWDGYTAASTRLLQSATTPRVELNAGTSLIESTGYFTLGSYHLVKGYYNSTTSIFQIDNNTAVTGNAGTTNAAGFTLGAYGNGGTRWANVIVKYVIIYSGTPSASDEAKIKDYLNKKAGL